MLLELARPVALLLSILSLTSAFHAAFLAPATTIEDRLQHALLRLAFAAVISFLGGLLFQESAATARPYSRSYRRPLEPPPVRYIATLPVRLFLWTAAAFLLLFAASWYIETYCILYKDVHY